MAQKCTHTKNANWIELHSFCYEHNALNGRKILSKKCIHSRGGLVYVGRSWHRLKIMVNISDVEALMWLNVEMIQRNLPAVGPQKVILHASSSQLPRMQCFQVRPFQALKDRAPIWTMLNYYFVGALVHTQTHGASKKIFVVCKTSSS